MLKKIINTDLALKYGVADLASLELALMSDGYDVYAVKAAMKIAKNHFSNVRNSQSHKCNWPSKCSNASRQNACGKNN